MVFAKSTALLRSVGHAVSTHKIPSSIIVLQDWWTRHRCWTQKNTKSKMIMSKKSSPKQRCPRVCQYTGITAEGGGGSFKNRKPIGEAGCYESQMAERIHRWTERWLKLCFLEWLQCLQWPPHPQLLDVVSCSAVVIVVVVWCSGVVVVMWCN